MAAEKPVAKKLDYLFKLVLVGDPGVGKTSILRRFSSNDFVANPTITASLAIDFKTRTLDIDGKHIKLQIWDTAGQERYSMRTVTKAYFRGSAGIVIVYDVTSALSYDNARRWLEVVLEHGIPDASIMLLGNKSDLSWSRAMTVEDGRQFAKDCGGTYTEVSAKTGDNVELAFISFAKRIKDTKEHRSREPSSSPELIESVVVAKEDSGTPRKGCISSCK